MCEKHFHGKMKRLLVHISYTVKVAIHVSGWDSLTLDIRVDSNRLRVPGETFSQFRGSEGFSTCDPVG